MKNTLILNGHQRYDGIAEGNLTNTLLQSASQYFTNNGFTLKQTNIDDGYDIKEEVEKLSWADVIFFQHPVYWMGLPWITKKYIDEVISAGKDSATYVNDGRSRTDSSKKYGSGGLMQGKKYMLSLTYNCPTSEFSNQNGFFDGLSIDQANIATHKIFQFCGLEPLQTYSLHDIFKGDLDIEEAKQNLLNVLKSNFS